MQCLSLLGVDVYVDCIIILEMCVYVPGHSVIQVWGVFTQHHFQLKMGEKNMHFGCSFTTQQHFGSLPMQAFENGFQSAGFWKQYHYCLCC